MSTIESPEHPEDNITKTINEIRQNIHEMMRGREKISLSEIHEIRDHLAQIPNLVINFDDTITKPPESDPADPKRKTDNYSIRAICREVTKLAKEDTNYSGNKAAAQLFVDFLDGKLATTELLKNAERTRSPIAYFYTKVLGGITKQAIDVIYNTIVNNINPAEAVDLNGNFITALEIIAETLDEKIIKLFVLSLNTSTLMKKWYDKHLPVINQKLAEKGLTLELIEIMGNQIAYNENDKISGVVEHVTNDNKKDYIPYGTIMLADDRETEKRADDFVNVVNIEGKKFNKKLVRYAAIYRSFANELELIGYKLTGFTKLPELFVNLTIYLKNLIILYERLGKDNSSFITPVKSLSKDNARENILAEIEKHENEIELIFNKLKEQIDKERK